MDSILNLIVFIAVTVIVNKIEIIQAIKASILATIFEFICEGINVFILQFIMKKDLNSLFSDPMRKIVYSSPSILFFGCIVILYYIILLKRKELKDITYGKTNK